MTMHDSPLLVAIFNGTRLGFRDNIPVHIDHIDFQDTVSALQSILCVSNDDQGSLLVDWPPSLESELDLLADTQLAHAYMLEFNCADDA